MTTTDDDQTEHACCEAITSSGARCGNDGYVRVARKGSKGRRVCNAHKNATRFIPEEQQREAVARYMAHRTPHDLAVLSAIDRCQHRGMLWRGQIIDAMTDSERALFRSPDEVDHVISVLGEKRALRIRHYERYGMMVRFVLRPQRREQAVAQKLHADDGNVVDLRAARHERGGR